MLAGRHAQTPPPDYKTLKVIVPYRGSQGPRRLLIDSTGIKGKGKGEWNAGKHGGARRPSPLPLELVAKPWLDERKIHIGIDDKTREVRAAAFTTNDADDVAPVCATGSSEPARHVARTS